MDGRAAGRGEGDQVQAKIKSKIQQAGRLQDRALARQAGLGGEIQGPGGQHGPGDGRMWGRRVTTGPWRGGP